MDHPAIARTLRTGYPEPFEPTGAVDVYGDEIGSGDTYVIDQDSGEIIHEDNIKRYTEEYCNFKYMEG
jgi:hypothetical protein